MVMDVPVMDVRMMDVPVIDVPVMDVLVDKCTDLSTDARKSLHSRPSHIDRPDSTSQKVLLS